ncbi:hypothetical protein AKJ16_DCAP17880 [Drosera capensis]
MANPAAIGCCHSILIFLLVMAAATATATPSIEDMNTTKHKQKKVHCKEKGYTECRKKSLLCPASCPRTCTVDCKSCTAMCTSTVKQPIDSPATPTGAAKVVKCKNKKYPGCYYREYTCPASCPRTCDVDCVTCTTVCTCDKPGAVCQDPRFIGGDGRRFYFHGKKDRDFCLVTDPNLHINGHFIGKRNETMSRDFTWVQGIGILFDNHQIYVGAKKTTIWDDNVDRVELTVDSKPIYLPESEGSSWSSDSITITRNHNTNDVIIEVEGNFRIKVVVVPITHDDSMVHKYGITNDDCFAHLDLSFKFYSLTANVNGVLGQTYATNYVSKINLDVQMPILGGNKEFSTSGLFAPDCEVSRFNANPKGNVQVL